MIRSKSLLIAAFAAACILAAPVSSSLAGDTDPLFINLTSDEGHRVDMALGFGNNQHKRGHKLTVFLNDRAVLTASKANAGSFGEQQKLIGDMLASGVTILVCPTCMKHYGVKEEDLLPGLKVSNPELTGAALFEDNARSLSW